MPLGDSNGGGETACSSLWWCAAVSRAISNDSGDGLVETALVVGATTVVLVLWLLSGGRGKKSSNNGGTGHHHYADIPWAPGGLPLLGHALSYQRDPSGFLLGAREACGGSSLFWVNLAGRRMVLVCGPEEQRQLAGLPDSVLSLREAIAEIGFEQSLGRKNVYEGTQIHKGIVKAIWSRAANEKNSDSGNEQRGPADRQLVAWQDSIRGAMEKELAVASSAATAGSGVKVEFLGFLRRVMLRASVEMFLGKAFLAGWTGFDFLEEFVGFQDTLEDVTAKAAVLPRWFALVALLWPLGRKRETLQRVIEKRLEAVLGMDGDNDAGFWLEAVLAQGVPVSDVAEFVVGLLFAAHKNPAIGAAQTYLLLREHGSEEVLERCRSEAEALLSETDPVPWSGLGEALPTLRRACLESLRLTAHSIGGIRKAQRDITVTVSAEKGDQLLRNEAAAAAKTITYQISRGTTVGFAHTTSSLDPSIWGADAARFDAGLDRYPEDKYQDDYSFTTFSNGTHRCPGRVLAMVQLQLANALLLAEYEVELPETLPALDFERATLAQREGPVLVSITKRTRT
ncbi:unnamed protein product [Pseudo-nitzschia multistriata]|uniref:Cytochrome P450 n=1 Tax=Pseudo-nitzschia multistriata TaxID=183589 RepID=A0A448YW41_9STRA|nr:unnamed protein product [Pseudo-nitzschia multistriata]